MMRPDAGPYLVSTTAIVVENTHNFGGGTVQPLAAAAAAPGGHAAAGVTLHLDGARLWNAHVASGVPLLGVRRAVRHGVGVPVQGPGRAGRVGAGVERRARSPRPASGASGWVAGCARWASSPRPGCYALDHHVERLADDHRRARRVAEALAETAPGCVDPASVETNIVVLATPDAARLAEKCKEQGVLVSVLDPRHLRLVTHLDVDDDDVDRRGDRAGVAADEGR